jgi:hypothetical protein
MLTSKEKIEHHIKVLEKATRQTRECTRQIRQAMADLAYLESLRSSKEGEDVAN